MTLQGGADLPRLEQGVVFEYEVTFLNQFHDLVCCGSAPCLPRQHERHKLRPPSRLGFLSLDLPAYLYEATSPW